MENAAANAEHLPAAASSRDLRGAWFLCAGIFASLGSLAAAKHVAAVSPGLGLVAGWILSVAGIPAAVLSARLDPGSRHTFNLHYAAFAGLAGTAWILPLLGLLGAYPWAVELGKFGIAFATPWAFAHLLAAASGRVGVGSAAACAGWALGFAAMHPPRGLMAAGIMIAGVMALRAAGRADERAKQSGAAWGLFSFALVNVVALAAFPAILASVLAPLWLGVDSFTLPEWRGAFAIGGTLVRGSEDFPLAMLAVRWAAIAAGMLVGALAPLLLPAGPRSGMAIGGAIFFAGAACAWGGVADLPMPILRTAAAFACLLAALWPLAGIAGARGACAVLGAAIGATLGLNLALPAVAPRPELFLPWLAEHAGIAVVWGVAYLFGVRLLRNAEES